MAKKQRIEDFDSLELLNICSGLEDKPLKDVKTFKPEKGMISYVKEEKKEYVFNGKKWVKKNKKFLILIFIPIVVAAVTLAIVLPLTLKKKSEPLKPYQYLVNGHTITLNIGAGESIGEDAVTYNPETGKIEVKNPEKTGYEFDGWYVDEAKTIEFDPEHVEDDVTLYPSFTIKVYNITYELLGGTNAEANPATYTVESETFTLASASKDGFIFGGWFKEVEYTTQVTSIAKGSTGDLLLYAKWDSTDPGVTTFVVTFNTNGGSAVPAQSVNEGTPATKPADPAKANYDFGGWYSDASLTTPFDFATPITSNTTLYAKWDAQTPGLTYTVTFNSNGGSPVSSQTVNSGATVPEPVDPTKDNCDFEGWYSDEGLTVEFNFGTPITGNITLYAKWHKNTFTVSFVGPGTNSVSPQEVAPGGKATNPGDLPGNEYAKFVGWYADKHGQNLFDFDTVITADTIIYSRFIMNEQEPTDTVTVTFNTQGGTPAVAPQTILAGTYVTIPDNPTRDYSTFLGWGYSKDYLIDLNVQPFFYDADLNAYYEVAPEGIWTITYETYGGVKMNEYETFPETYDAYMQYLDLPYLKKEHYVFDGWYLDAEFTEENHVPSFAQPIDDERLRGNITLYAKFHLKTFAVNFFADDDVASHDSPPIETQIVEYGGYITRPDESLNPIPYPYNTFEDWYGKDPETGKYFLFDFSEPLLLSDDEWYYTVYAMFSPSVNYVLVGEGTEDAHYIIRDSANFHTEHYGPGSATKPLTFDTHNNIPITEVGPYAFAKGYRGEDLPSDDTRRMNGGVKTGPSLKVIRHHAFANCAIDEEWWSWIDLSQSLELELEPYAFFNAGSARFIKLPATLKDVPDYCFEGASITEFLELPLALETIGNSSFKNLSWMQRLHLRRNIKSIGPSAFEGCSELSKVYYEGSAADRAKIEIESGNDTLEGATWYYFTENGENETTPGYWWYWTTEYGGVTEKVVE